jgi:hypothetical protein
VTLSYGGGGGGQARHVRIHQLSWAASDITISTLVGESGTSTNTIADE